jgi:apolipoprotein N-acyltransferase
VAVTGVVCGSNFSPGCMMACPRRVAWMRRRCVRCGIPISVRWVRTVMQLSDSRQVTSPADVEVCRLHRYAFGEMCTKGRCSLSGDAEDCCETTPPDGNEHECSAGREAAPSAAGKIWALALSASVVAGLLLWTSFPELDWWWGAVAAFALLGAVLIRAAITPVGVLGYGFLFGLAFYMPLLPWTSDFVGVWPWLILTAICAAYPALFGMFAVVVRGLPGWPIWFAALWAAQEWAKSMFPFGGFPWGSVGFGQTAGPLLPLAALGGVPLLSAAIVLLGCTATAITVAIARGRPDAGAATHPTAVLAPALCVCAVALAIGTAGADAESGQGPAVTVAAVQGNVPRLGYDFNAQRRAVLDNHVRETLRLADNVRSGRAQAPRIVVWPENSSDIDPLTNADAAQQIATAAQNINAPILVGMIRAAPGATSEYPMWMNTVWVFDPRTGWGKRHDKVIIEPFGEYVPWRGFFRLLSEHADDAGYFTAGQSNGVVHAAGIPVGVSTCWEVLFDRAPRSAVVNGAGFLAVPSNNATFDATMSRQQLAVSKARAVEHDRYVVVAGTTGISAVIAPDGRVMAQTGFNQSAYLDMPVHLETRLTPATRWGPVVQWVLVAVGFGAVVAAVGHRFRRPRR